MKESILRRFPQLQPDDVLLRDDGAGIYLEVWNSEEPEPTMEKVLSWVEEDRDLPKAPTEQERIEELENLMNLMLMGVI